MEGPSDALLWYPAENSIMTDCDAGAACTIIADICGEHFMIPYTSRSASYWGDVLGSSIGNDKTEAEVEQTDDAADAKEASSDADHNVDNVEANVLDATNDNNDDDDTRWTTLSEKDI